MSGDKHAAAARMSGAWQGTARVLRLADDDDGPAPSSGAKPEHLAAINSMAKRMRLLRPVTPSDGYVRGIYFMNDQPMHNSLVIPKDGIEATVAAAEKAMPCVPLMANHDTMNLPLGRLFKAYVETDEQGVTWGAGLAWIPATEHTSELVRRMDLGAIGESSVQVTYDDMQCSICETSMEECSHVPGREYDGKLCLGVVQGVKDFLELSMVWAGQARGTSFFMAASRGSQMLDAEDFVRARQRDADAQIDSLVGAGEDAVGCCGADFDELDLLLAESTTSTQSVILAKTHFKSRGEAKKWVKNHSQFKDNGVDETSTSYRFRQFDPGLCAAGTFRNFVPEGMKDQGVTLVLCRKK